MKTLGIKYEVIGFKDAANSIKQLKQGIKDSIKLNQDSLKQNIKIARSEKERGKIIERANQNIFFSYLRLRKSIRQQNDNIAKDTKKSFNQIKSDIDDYFKYNYGSKVQKQQVIIKQEKKDFAQRSTHRNLDKNSRNQVLEQRLIFKELILDAKKIINEDLNTVIKKSVSEVSSNSDSSFKKITNVVKAPFDIAGKAILSPIEAIVFGGLQKIGEEQVKDFAQGVSSQLQKNLGLQFKEVGQDLGGAIGSSGYLAYEKISSAGKNSLIDNHKVSGRNAGIHAVKLLDDLGQILQGFVLSLGAIPIKVKKRIDLDKKAIPQVKEKAGELMINRNLTQAQEAEIEQSKSITILTGGANYDEQAGTTDFAHRTLQPMLRGSYVHKVKNLFSNAQNSEDFDRIFGEMLSLGLSNANSKQELLEFARNNMPESDSEESLSDEELEQLFEGDAEQVSQKITDFFKQIKLPLPKILEVVFKGYNPDDIQMAAEGIFFKEQYPDKPLQFIGTSFGGFNAAGAAEIMNRMGYEDVKGVGVTTPIIGMESTVNPENYMSSIGDLDFLYEMTLGSVFEGKVPKPDNLQVVPNKGKGHLLGHFLAQSPEFRNFLQYFLKGRVDVPSMQEYTGKEVMAMGRIAGDNAESAIVRTIKKNLGEKHEEGYTFNTEDLQGHRDHLLRLAGGTDLRKIKNPQLKEFYQDYIDFLDTFLEELEVIEKFEQVGTKFKPINSLRKAANFYPDLGHFIESHPDFGIEQNEYNQAQAEVEKNKNLVNLKRKIKSESPNLERTYRAILGEDISEKGYGYYDDEEYETRANEHLNGLIDYFNFDILANASDQERAEAQPYIDLLNKLKANILQVGETGSIDTADILEAEQLLGINLKDYRKVLQGSEVLNVREDREQIQSIAEKARQGKQSNLVKDLKPELEAYIWAINQELIRQGKQTINYAEAEYLGSGYKNHAIKANGVVYKFARHTNPLARKVNKIMGKDDKKYQEEIAALKALKGHNVPEFVANGDEFLAMGEAQGITLKQALEEANLEEKIELLKKAAELLKKFHEQGVAHFDFHPGNIILGDDGELTAIDWESAELTRSNQQHYYDREVAVSRFQDVLPNSINVEELFNQSYYGQLEETEIELGAEQLAQAYQAQLERIVEFATERALQAIEAGEQEQDLDAGYDNIRDLVSQYRQAVADSNFEMAMVLGERLLEETEYYKQLFNNTDREDRGNRSGQLTRIQNEILRGDRGAGRVDVGLADIANQPGQRQLIIDFENIGELAQQGFLEGAAGLEAGQQFAEDVIEGATDEFDIQSPSRVFNWIGSMVREGFDLGVEGITENLSELIQNAVDGASESVDEVAENISSTAQELDESESVLDRIFETEGLDEGIGNFFSDIIDSISDTFNEISTRYPILGRIKDVLIELGGELLQLLGLGALSQFLIEGSKAALEVAKEIESLEKSIISVSSSSIDGARNIAFIREEAQKLAIDLVSAEESYKRILGATRNTPLEGLQTQQIFTTLASTAKNRGLNTDATNRLFLGFEQAIAKGEFKAEEVRGQLAEVLGDIQNLLATSVGVNVNQLSDLMEAGDLRTIEVMPKLLAVLNAQNAALGDNIQTAQAAQTKFNNSLLIFQDLIGRKLQPVQKLGLNVLADVLDFLQNKVNGILKLLVSLMTTILVNLTLKIVGTNLVVKGLIHLILLLTSSIAAALPKLVMFAKRFFLISIAIEIWANNLKLAKNAFPELEKKIESSTKRLNALRRAFEDTGEAAKNYGSDSNQLELKEGLKLPDNWFGNKVLKPVAGGEHLNFDNLIRNRINKAEKFTVNSFANALDFYGFQKQASNARNRLKKYGITTQAQKKQADFVIGAGDLNFNANETLSYSQEAKNVLENIAKLDKEARQLQSKRNDILAGDTEGLKQALEAEKKVLEERDKLLAKTSQYQESLQKDIQDVKDTLLELDELDLTGGTEEERSQRDNTRKSLEGTLKALETEKKAIDKINSRIPTFLSETDRMLRNSQERVAGFITQQDKEQLQNRNEILKEAISEGLSQAEVEFKVDDSSTSNLVDRINFVNQEISKLEDKLENAYLQEGVKSLERSAREQARLDGSEYLGLTPEILQRVVEQNIGTAQEIKSANLLLALNEYRDTVAQSESELLDLLKNQQVKFKDLNRTIEDYFFNLIQQLKEARIETRKLINQLFATNIKNKLKNAIAPGSESFISGIVDGIESILDQATSLIEQSLGLESAENQLKAEQRSLELEMRDFLKNIGGANDALVEFRKNLNLVGGGGSSTDHLDYRIQVNGKWIDPKKALTNVSVNDYGKSSPSTSAPFVSNEGYTGTIAQKASNLNNQLISQKQKNLNIQQILNRVGLGQDLERAIANQKARITQEYKLNIAEETNKVADLQDKVADFSTRSRINTASDEVAQELRGARAEFRGVKTEKIQELNTASKVVADTKAIQSILPDVINQLNANPQYKNLVPVLQTFLTESQSALPIFEQQLTQKTQGYQNILSQEAKILDFLHRQGQLKVEAERLGQEIELQTIRTNIATQEGNLEQKLQNELINEHYNYQQKINQIKLDHGDSEFANNLIDLETQQYELNKKLLHLRGLGEKLARKTEVQQLKTNIATERGTNELRRQNEQAAERLRYEQRINQIKTDFGDSQHAQDLLLLEKRQHHINFENINRGAYDRDQELEQKLLDLNSGITSGTASHMRLFAYDFRANKLERENAIAQENYRYQQELVQLNRQYEAEPDKLAELKARAEALNQVNLQGITTQFKSLGDTIKFNAIDATTEFFTNWFQDIGNAQEHLRQFVISILKSIAQIAARQAASRIVSAIFGGGFKQGGTIPNYSEGGRVVPDTISDRLKQVSTPIKNAFNREGSQGVLGVFTPGEEILSLRTGEAQRYQYLKSRFGINPLDKMFAGNFADGGTVDIEKNILSGIEVKSPTIANRRSRSAVGTRSLGRERNYGNTVNHINLSTTVISPDADSFRASSYQVEQDRLEMLKRNL